MEVKPGYKQTEVGVIPEDWFPTPIGTLGTFSKGQGVRKNEANSGDIPCVRYGEIYTHHNDVIRSFNSWISFTVASTSKRLKSGDLLFAGSGETKEEIGKCVAFIGDEKAYAGGDIVILSPTKGDSKFFGYLFNAPVVARQKASKGQGDAVVHISSNALSSITIPLPPTEAEQRAIATALSDVDALLDGLDRLIAKKRDLKQAAMQQLLTGKTRLPGFEGEWREGQIGPEIDLLTGYPFPSADYLTSGIKLLRGSNIKRGVTDWSDDIVQYWPKITSDIIQYVLKEGDIVIAMDGSLVGRSFARLSDADLPALLLQRVARIRSQKIDMGYLKEWICSEFFTKHCEAHKTVTAIPHISPGDIRSFSIQIPPTFEEQTAIASVLSDMDAEIAAMEQRRNKTKDIKQAMMQELLTGKTRLI